MRARVSGNIQFEKVGDVILNTDMASLKNYKKQKELQNRLAKIEARLENIESVLLKGLIDGFTKDS